jgi:hypothetical protein
MYHSAGYRCSLCVPNGSLQVTNVPSEANNHQCKPWKDSNNIKEMFLIQMFKSVD